MPGPDDTLRKATSIGPAPTKGWLARIGDMTTSSAVNPVVNFATGENYGEEPGPVDLGLALFSLLAASKGLISGGKAAVTGADAALTPISKDPYALRKGPMDRRNFLYRASTMPGKAAKAEYETGLTKFIDNLEDKLDPIRDEKWGPVTTVETDHGTTLTGRHGEDGVIYPQGKPLSPESTKILKDALKQVSDKAKTARNINRKYKFHDRTMLGRQSDDAYYNSSTMYDLQNISEDAGILNGKLEKEFTRAMNTEPLIDEYQLNKLQAAKTPKPGYSGGNPILDSIFKRFGHEIIKSPEVQEGIVKPVTKAATAVEGSPIVDSILKRFGIDRTR